MKSKLNIKVSCYKMKFCLLLLLCLSFFVNSTGNTMSFEGNDQVFHLILKEDSNAVKAIETEMLKEAAENIERYRKGDVAIVFKDETGKPVQNAEIKINQKSHDFLFGALIYDLVRDESSRPALYKQLYKDIFNFAVLSCLWTPYEPVPGMTQWERILPVISWCKENGITIKAHHLVWTNPAGVPDWLSDFSVPMSEELLKARIINLVKGYKGKIDDWDVVNEATHTRTWKHVEANYATKETIQDAADFCEMPFRWAYFANPEGNLVLNEFQQIMSLAMRQRFYNLVAELQKRGTPITGIGIQAHEPWDCWFPPKEVWATFDNYTEFGYPIHITEFMPQSNGKEITGGWRQGVWTKENQADFAEQFYRLCFGHPAIASVCWMGLSDQYIYLPGGGLIDENYKPKPVYNRLRKLIHEEWKTNLTSETNKEGRVTFRGFYGQYNIDLILDDGKIKSFEFHVSENEGNNWVFTVKDK